MKLYHFKVSGNAEPARIMLEAAGVPFEDVAFSYEDWASYKTISPTITFYVAHLTGFSPKTHLAIARSIEVGGAIADIWTPVTPTFEIADDNERILAREKLFSKGGEAYERLQVLENLVAAMSTTGDVDLFVSEVSLFAELSFITTGECDGLSKVTLEPFGHLTALRNRIAGHPKVKPLYMDAKDGLVYFKPDTERP